MNCPKCKIKLTRTSYSGLFIYTCQQCEGSLLKYNRLQAIESRDTKDDQELLVEFVQGKKSEFVHKIRCPHCYKTMERRAKRFGASAISIDRCYTCEFIWLDSKELAAWQIAFRNSERGQEKIRFRERLKNMTPEERADLEQRINNLPQRGFLDGLRDATEPHHDLLMDCLLDDVLDGIEDFIRGRNPR